MHAFYVGKLGSLSAAAKQLNVHHSTVLRKIDALEQRLGTKLFHRSPSGYKPTLAGEELVKSGSIIEAELGSLIGRIRGYDKQISGVLSITTVDSMVPILAPAIAAFREQYPQIKIELINDGRRFRLEHGEADISLRPGRPAEELDYVARRVASLRCGVFGSKTFLLKKGGQLAGGIPGLSYVSGTERLSHLDFIKIFDNSVDACNIAFRANDIVGIYHAIGAGIGIGPLYCALASMDPNLVQVQGDWDLPDVPLWLITHKDFKRSRKIRAFIDFLKHWLSSNSQKFVGLEVDIEAGL